MGQLKHKLFFFLSHFLYLSLSCCVYKMTIMVVPTHRVVVRYEYNNRHCSPWASLVAQLVKNPLAVRETWVQSLGWEDPLEKGVATHSDILAWRIPVDRGAWRMTGVTKSWT